MDTFNATKGATILIVDDSRFQRTIIRELLREHFNIFEAESGEECLGIIKKDKVSIDLLILDLERRCTVNREREYHRFKI